MSHLLNCFMLGDEPDRVFNVKIQETTNIMLVRDLIKEKMAPHLNHIAASDLDLWKVNFPFHDLKARLENFKPDPYLKLAPIEKLLSTFKDVLDDDHIHVIAKVPATISPSSSDQSNLSAYNSLKRPHSPQNLDGVKRPRTDVNWLLELHSKLWNRENLRKELFHTVEITAGHYKQLQYRLTELRAARNFKPNDTRVLSIKLDVLRSLNVSITPDPTSDDEQIEAENNEVVDDIDDELYSLFPATIDFLDLSSLELEEQPPRMPQPLLVREEYKFLTKMLDELPKDGSGSATVSGQPGTGKTAYLHLRLVESMIAGCPFLFQTIGGTVYHVSDCITMVNSWKEKEAIIAFVDGDNSSFEPQEILRYNTNVQIIVASSPKATDKKWMKQLPDGSFVMAFVTQLWSFNELFLTGIFLAPRDITYARLKESTFYLGLNPRLCFQASLDVRKLDILKLRIKQKIRNIPPTVDIMEFFNQTHSSKGISHLIFQLSPLDNDDIRLLESAQVSAVSSWALDVLLVQYEDRQADAAFQFYTAIGNIPGAGALRGQMFERQILKYFDSLKQPHPFTIRSLADSNTTSQWVYPGPTRRFEFQSSTFAQSLQSAVTNGVPLHLVPKDPNFPAVDSILYHPQDVLTGIQVTIRTDHPVAVTGLKRIQGWLKRNTFGFLRPLSAGRHWQLIFVVPDTIANSFTKQIFENDTVTQEWARKVDQYVLGMKEETVWGKFR